MIQIFEIDTFLFILVIWSHCLRFAIQIKICWTDKLETVESGQFLAQLSRIVSPSSISRTSFIIFRIHYQYAGRKHQWKSHKGRWLHHLSHLIIFFHYWIKSTYCHFHFSGNLFVIAGSFSIVPINRIGRFNWFEYTHVKKHLSLSTKLDTTFHYFLFWLWELCKSF